MQRYFFDVGFPFHIQYDFSGQCFSSEEQARDLAEMIALDVACADADTEAHVEVQVRNVTGDRLFAIAVQKRELVAA